MTLNGFAVRLAHVTAADAATSVPEGRLKPLTFVLLCAVHVALAFLFRSFETVATIHAVVTFIVGLWIVLKITRPEHTLYLCSYIVGCELLWRVAGAIVFWELAKYGVILFSMLTVLRFRLLGRVDRSFLVLPLLLLPSILILPAFDRRQIAFNLAGPVSLAAATLLFSVVRLDRPRLVRILTACVAPITGLAALGMVSTLEAGPSGIVVYGSATTAGFGPNQFSLVLGLGMTLAFLLAFLAQREETALQRLALLVASALGVQCLLSLSRGGMWSGLGAIAVASWYLIRNRRVRSATFAVALAVIPVLLLWVVPAVDAYSGGVVVRRFQDRGLTGRDQLMLADLVAFKENPLFGVGPGQSVEYHERTFRRASSHTEYTRLLAEHGLFGVGVIVILGVAVRRRLVAGGSLLEKATVMSLTAWALLTLAHSAMRVAAPGFIFGLAAATFVLDPSDDGSSLALDREP